MNFEECRMMAPLYLTGYLTGADLEVFEEHLKNDARLRIELGELREIWDGLGVLENNEQPSVAMRARFYRKLGEVANGKSRRPNWLLSWWSLPSLRYGAALLFVAGLGAGILVAPRWNADPEKARLRAEVQHMRELITLSMLNRQSAAARLEGISWSMQMQRPDPQISAALLSALDDDSDVNVRLSTVDALQNLASDPNIRAAMLAAIPRQQSPLVQIALIDSLVQAKSPEDVKAFQQIAHDAAYDENVRQRARWALQQFQKQ
jgi:hypothetical protein